MEQFFKITLFYVVLVPNFTFCNKTFYLLDLLLLFFSYSFFFALEASLELLLYLCDSFYVTRDTFYVTRDTFYVTRDTFYVTHDTFYVTCTV